MTSLWFADAPASRSDCTHSTISWRKRSSAPLPAGPSRENTPAACAGRFHAATRRNPLPRRKVAKLRNAVMKTLLREIIHGIHMVQCNWLAR